MNVLVTGGAGYIGSHAVKQLLESGHHVVVIDSLLRGHRAAVHADADFYPLALCETGAIARAMIEHRIECVMHFAALAYVGESVGRPLDYYENNVGGAVSLLQAMKTAGVRRLVFSSTCATYGQPERSPVVETMRQEPMSPYGWSKWCVERILRDTSVADPGFAFVSLRYFNVAGAAADGSLGEDHRPETHLIPLVLQVAMGRREALTVFGSDYPTADGTCVRDYIHVEDLCAAHILAMEAIGAGDSRFYNLGIGRGYSVQEVLQSAERVTGRAIAVEYGARRPGDPAELFADSGRIQTELGWKPRYTEIDQIVGTAWEWFRRHPQGYGER